MARRHARLFQRGRRRLTNRARSGGFGPGVEQREGVVLGDHLQQFDDIAVAVTAVGGEHRSRPARRTVKLHAEGRKPLIFRLGVVDIKADVAEPRIAHAAFAPDALTSEEHTSDLQSLMSISYAVVSLNKK